MPEPLQTDQAFSLAGLTALVTGGASGIGLSIATAFVGSGARVALVDRDPNVEMAARSLGPDHIGLVVDVARRSAAPDGR